MLPIEIVEDAMVVKYIVYEGSTYIYTDGSVSDPKNKEGSLGGWGALLIYPNGDKRAEICDREDPVTISRMEMTAIKEGLKQAIELDPGSKYTVYSDSMYCVKSFNEWCHGWVKNGWRNSQRKK